MAKFDALTGRTVSFNEVSFVSDKTYLPGDSSWEYSFMDGGAEGFSLKAEFGRDAIIYTQQYDHNSDGEIDTWLRTVYGGSFEYSKKGFIKKATVQSFVDQSVRESSLGAGLYNRSTVYASDLRNGKGLRVKSPSSFAWPELLPYQQQDSALTERISYEYRDQEKVYFSGDEAKENSFWASPDSVFVSENWHLSPFSNLI